MSILILNRLSKSKKDYEEWFSELNEEISMLGHPKTINDFKKITYKKSFDNFMWNGEVDWEAIRLHREKPFRAIVALEEGEILRAAKLRSYLGIKGQSYQSALAFRNKFIMKKILSDNGISVAPFRRIDNPVDLFDFSQEQGFPIVVKPLLGMSSKDVDIFSCKEELMAWIQNSKWENMLAEKYIEGIMFHVDGIVMKGELAFACAFSYINTCLSYTESKGVGNTFLEEQNPLGQRLIEFVKEVLKALPTPEYTSIHAEIFLTPDDKLLLCEIASRTAGGSIPDLVTRVSGVDLDKYISRAQVGLVDELPVITFEHGSIGNYLFQPKDGTLLTYPESLPFEWVIEYKKTGQIGQSYTNTKSSAMDYARVYVVGDSERQVRERLTEVINYIEINTVWEINKG